MNADPAVTQRGGLSWRGLLGLALVLLSSNTFIRLLPFPLWSFFLGYLVYVGVLNIVVDLAFPYLKGKVLKAARVSVLLATLILGFLFFCILAMYGVAFVAVLFWGPILADNQGGAYLMIVVVLAIIAYLADRFNVWQAKLALGHETYENAASTGLTSTFGSISRQTIYVLMLIYYVIGNTSTFWQGRELPFVLNALQEISLQIGRASCRERV